ncbi:MAG TPA: DegQ family serine endoprotease [Stellaceae bacterium]|nr:DegQ family serine endoprotease [Stellaceae bacterium]
MLRLLASSLIALFVVTSGAAAQSRAAPESREAIHLSFAPVVKKVAPAVVNVYSRRTVRAQSPFFNDPFFQRFFGENSPFAPRERVLNSLGSGVILDPGGLVVTNSHVIKDAQEVRVVLSDRREFEAHIALTDERADLAVLRIDTHGERLPTLELGDSDGLEVGDLVLAIGNPFGVGQTVTSGIVSALARTDVGISDFQSFIQTDAAINPGNSGGALVDLDGRLVGINTAIFSRSGGSIGIGFAIPAAMVRIELEAASSGSRILRPWFGASTQEVTAEIAENLGLPHPEGVLIKDVAPGSPAAQAGLRLGDVILEIGGHEIYDPDGLRFRVATLPVDQPVKLTLWRAHQRQKATVVLTRPPEDPPRDMIELTGDQPFAGATVGNLNPAYDDELGLDPKQRGVVVDAVHEGSAAARLGLERGDIVASIGRRTVENVAQLKEILSQSGSPWKLGVRRGDRLISVTVR